MNPYKVFLTFALLLASATFALGQGTSPQERRTFREYTSPEELVSIAPSTPLDKALEALSEVSEKFIGKVIIDTERRALPIGVDIEGMQWRDALETICRKNDLWYSEYENYIQITSLRGPEEATAGAKLGEGIQRELATFQSREIKISAIFFEVNLSTIEEVGINWSFMKSTSDITIDASQTGADRLTDDIFEAGLTPKLNFANIDLLAKVFSSYDLGDILSAPQITVRSGEEGRIQVGQDFSIKERDFAGNLIDKFYSAGTIINVRPQVITEQGVDFVHMAVDVERSSVIPGTVSTIINKTEASTNVLLLDGEETIIGGLYNTATSTVRVGLPFLKDLPWYVFGLRYLFGYNRDQVTKKELVILLKAELVPTLQERITQKTRGDRLFERWLDEKTQDEQRVKGRRE
ncbi:MAG: type II and III secretion system protein [Ignavibacteria bacterium]|nr:type II and III secretion system protein [Ignavibacteria bacterium]